MADKCAECGAEMFRRDVSQIDPGFFYGPLIQHRVGSEDCLTRQLFQVRKHNAKLLEACNELVEQLGYLRGKMSAKWRQFTSSSTEGSLSMARAAIANVK